MQNRFYCLLLWSNRRRGHVRFFSACIFLCTWNQRFFSPDIRIFFVHVHSFFHWFIFCLAIWLILFLFAFSGFTYITFLSRLAKMKSSHDNTYHSVDPISPVSPPICNAPSHIALAAFDLYIGFVFQLTNVNDIHRLSEQNESKKKLCHWLVVVVQKKQRKIYGKTAKNVHKTQKFDFFFATLANIKISKGRVDERIGRPIKQ